LVYPAQGNALGTGNEQNLFGPTGQPFVLFIGKPLARWADKCSFALSTQGDALGWKNGRRFAAANR
jgi:hypothetical protein